MLLDKTGVLREDPWRHLKDDEAAGDGESVTISLPRWEKERAHWDGRSAPLGLRIPNDVPPARLDGASRRAALIVLDFPRFTDGRAYSQAWLLRARFSFTGELRAAGHVLRDQILFMRRCGFDSFVVDGARARAEDWGRAFREFDLFYQPAADGQPTVMGRRFGLFRAAAE
jgi:uncharacterized protein (DUF934 family)